MLSGKYFLLYIFNNMIDNTKKILARDPYASPSCEVLDVKIEGKILVDSVDPLILEDWEDGITLQF